MMSLAYTHLREGLLMCNMTNITLPEETNLDFTALNFFLQAVDFHQEIEEGLWDSMMVCS